MTTTLITGSTLDARQEKLKSYRQPYQLILDCRDKDSRLIKAVRTFQKSLALSTATTKNHLIIEAQYLTLASQHALLKTLEEPPANTTFILTADQKNKLLPTILSRCQIIELQSGLNQTPEEIALAKDILIQINKGSYSDLLSLANKLNQDQTQLTHLLLLLKHSLHSSATKKRAQAVAAINTCLQDLQTNTQPLLAIEHLLFTLKSLN